MVGYGGRAETERMWVSHSRRRPISETCLRYSPLLYDG
eukprot:CAMPEP_0206126274 /NCGR_PEP_ID=MMETSP1472-20131121/21512_1 /ASSEMBLY_ACC=CAM_ASM_001108 /TAXON_ID=41880 /ORGANISM="Pycnococcus provasolii, Strain RCC251" /LENGTH=37 /DNA_ID= /DNA_START= /DNA_END= /DNA_ORIENTATION=